MRTAADQFRRMMMLLPRVATETTVSLRALSRELDCTGDEIVTDLRRLVDRFDDPVGDQDSIGVLIEGDRIAVRTNHFLRPMRVTAAELCALEVGLGVLAQQADAAEAAQIASLRTKLARCITSLPRDEAHVGLRAGGMTASIDRGVMAALRTALRRSVVVTFEYESASADEATERTVRPYGLLFHHGCWYLSSWCEDALEMRLFRCDRMANVVVTDRQHERPADYDVGTLMIDGRPFNANAATTNMVIRYAPTIARWIAERDGQPLESDGSAVRTMPLADREWAVRHVLQYGPDAEIVSPVELQEAVVERLRTLVG